MKGFFKKIGWVLLFIISVVLYVVYVMILPATHKKEKINENKRKIKKLNTEKDKIDVNIEKTEKEIKTLEEENKRIETELNEEYKSSPVTPEEALKYLLGRK